MKIYDISQELFSGNVYPGDPAPAYERILEIEKGDPCNLTSVQMGVHNATHMDAPYHFYRNGKSIEQLDLKRCIGPCTVVEFHKNEEMKLRNALGNCQKRLLLKGDGNITVELAKEINQNEILLVGVESQSVGPISAPMEVHLELLGREVVLLEGLVLEEIPEGEYFLAALPLKLGMSDGAPCRAVLLKQEGIEDVNEGI